RLFSILERQNSINTLQFKNLFVAMKDAYGLPQMTKENSYTVYTYKNDNTMALLIAAQSGSLYDIKIYLYAHSLFRKIFME
ncbi:MAG: hypothetical protein ACRCUT_05845, partial [Spirochaetota bacterium]